MNVFQIMTTPVVTTNVHNTVGSIRKKILDRGLHALPVLENDGNIAGIISSHDVAKTSNDDTPIENVMTKKVHIVMKNNRVVDAAKVMLKHHIHHLIVMEEGHVVGMISSLDVMESLLEQSE